MSNTIYAQEMDGVSIGPAIKIIPNQSVDAAVFVNLLKPIFTRLSDRTLLSRCQGGYTQNQNESLNNVLWSHCLKTKCCGYFKVHLAVCDIITHFNCGAAGKPAVMKKMGIKASPGSLPYVYRKDSGCCAQNKYQSSKTTTKAAWHEKIKN